MRLSSAQVRFRKYRDDQHKNMEYEDADDADNKYRGGDQDDKERRSL